MTKEQLKAQVAIEATQMVPTMAIQELICILGTSQKLKGRRAETKLALR